MNVQLVKIIVSLLKLVKTSTEISNARIAMALEWLQAFVEDRILEALRFLN